MFIVTPVFDAAKEVQSAVREEEVPMKKLMARVLALTALLGIPLLAQDIAGGWQGTLKAERDLRTVLDPESG